MASEDDSRKADSAVQCFQKHYGETVYGTIPREDLAKVLKLLNPAWTDDELEVLLSIADSRADGQVSFEEFISWLVGGDEDVLAQTLSSFPGRKK
mmetsp:Transcript_83114/g.130745  ORF Transcript_83114/g.130745 Transcript_83114/m.130745 type:complete len:95 (-) Transcript_83114:191-475(-)